MHWLVRLGMLTLLASLPGCLRTTYWSKNQGPAVLRADRQTPASAEGAAPKTIIIHPAAAPPQPPELESFAPESMRNWPATKPTGPVSVRPDNASPAELQPVPLENLSPPASEQGAPPAVKAEELNRLLKALEAFLEDRPDEALQLLKPYPAKDQELLLALLPIVAQIERKGDWPEQMNDAQKLARIDVLRSLIATLEPSAPLVIKKLEFARSVQGFGRYEPLPSPTFRPGDPVSLYVEIENLQDKRVSEHQYMVRLGSLLTMRQDGTNQGWQRTVPATPDGSRSPRDDHHAVIGFHIPSKDPPPPGTYTLSVEIIDLETRRRAERILTFRVSNQPASEQASARR